MTAYDSYVADIAARHAEYETLLKEKTTKIRETEAENMRQGKKKVRSLSTSPSCGRAYQGSPALSSSTDSQPRPVPGGARQADRAGRRGRGLQEELLLGGVDGRDGDVEHDRWQGAHALTFRLLHRQDTF